MKKFAPAFFSLLGVSLFLSCRTKNPLPTQKSGKSLLWEISGKGLKNPSYFLGTMHLMCAEDAVLSTTVQGLIKEVDTVYLEVDMDNAAELLSGLLELRSKQGKTLSNVLQQDDYNKVKAFFEKFQPNVPFSVIEQQPPLMISASLFELLLPCEQKNGIELKVIDEAYKQKKETKGLETIAFQASIFDSIPYEDQANELVKSIDSLDKNRKAMDEMMNVYKKQDIEELYKLSSSEESGVGNYMDLLLFKRNSNWVQQFPLIAANSATLFAVGAGHLGGEKGVLQLLRLQGYKVRPIVN